LLAGLVDLFEVSLLSDLELDALQPASFVLASLTFEALAAGTTTLAFVPDALFGIDVKRSGAEILGLQANSGRVTWRARRCPSRGRSCCCWRPARPMWPSPAAAGVIRCRVAAACRVDG